MRRLFAVIGAFGIAFAGVLMVATGASASVGACNPGQLLSTKTGQHVTVFKKPGAVCGTTHVWLAVYRVPRGYQDTNGYANPTAFPEHLRAWKQVVLPGSATSRTFRLWTPRCGNYQWDVYTKPPLRTLLHVGGPKGFVQSTSSLGNVVVQHGCRCHYRWVRGFHHLHLHGHGPHKCRCHR